MFVRCSQKSQIGQWNQCEFLISPPSLSLSLSLLFDSAQPFVFTLSGLLHYLHSFYFNERAILVPFSSAGRVELHGQQTSKRKCSGEREREGAHKVGVKINEIDFNPFGHRPTH